MKRESLLRYCGFLSSVTAARVAGLGITSLTFPYLVRRLGVEGYGLWSYVVVICAFLEIVADPGLTKFITQQIAARRADAFSLLPDYLMLRLLGASIAAVVVLTIASFERRSDIRHLLQLYGIGCLVVNLLSNDHLLTALEMFHERSFLTVSQQALYALGVFELVKAPKDILWLPASILVSSAITAFAGWSVLWQRGYRLHWSVNLKVWRSMLVPSFHYAASSMMSALYHRTGHLLVRFFLGDFALGLYSAAVRFVDLMRNFVIIVLNILMPRFALAAKSATDTLRVARFAATALAIVSIPLTLGLMVTAPVLVPLVLGAKYLGAVSLVRWMAPYLIAASAASLLSGTMLYALGRHRAYLGATAAGAVAGVLLYPILIPTIGLAGAAVAFVVAEFVVAGSACMLLPREFRGLWKNPAIGISCTAALMMAIVVRITSAYLAQAYLMISLGALVYVASGAWLARKWLQENWNWKGLRTQAPAPTGI